MNRPSFVLRLRAGRLFNAKKPGQTVKRRLLNAFALCTMPALSLGTAMAQQTDLVPPAVDEGIVAMQSDEGVVALQPVEDEGAVTLSPIDANESFVPPAVDAVFSDELAGSEPFGIEPVFPADNLTSDSDSGVAQTQFATPADPYAGGTYSSATLDTLGYAVTNDPSQVLYRVSRDQINIAGVDQGWTGVSAFIPVAAQGGDDLLFINPRLLLMDDGTVGGNFGVGKRWYDAVYDHTYELSAWFDYDSSFNNNYGQMGLASALISGNLEYRFGANWIVTDDVNTVGAATFGTTPTPRGSSLFVTVAQPTEYAYDRYDGEIAIPMGSLGEYGGTVGLGAYYLASNGGEDGAGVSGRFEAQINEDFWMNVVVTNDPIFNTNVSFNFEFTLPDGRPSEWLQKAQPRDYLTASTRRRYRPTVDLANVLRDEAVRNKDGSELRVAYIDPNRPNVTGVAMTPVEGTGTLDDPFVSLADFTEEAAGVRGAFDVLIVRPFRDTAFPADTDLNTTITLLDDQRLISDQLPYTFTGTVNGQRARFDLAAQRNNDPFNATTFGITDPYNFPTLSNSAMPATPVITLANNNLVTGFRIDATDTADGIVGTGITNFDISRNEIIRFIDAVDIAHVGDGYGRLEGNVVRGRTDTNAGGTTVADFGFTLADLGLTLDDFAAQTTVDPVTGNVVPITDEAQALSFLTFTQADAAIDLGDGFGRNGGLIVTSDGTLNALVRNNRVTGIAGEDRDQNNLLGVDEDLDMDGILDPGEDLNGNGILDASEDVDGDGLLDAGRAISLTALTGTINADLPDIIPVYSVANAFCPVLPTGIVGNTVGEFNADGTAVAGSGATFGIEVIAQPGTTANVVARDNRIGGGVGAPAGVVDPGFLFRSDNATFNVPEFSGNTVVSSSEDGAQFIAENGGTLTFANPAFVPLGDPSARPSFDNNSFTDNGTNGILVRADNGTVSFDALGTILPNNGLSSNTFSNNGASGIRLETLNNGDISVREPITGNTITGNTLDGLTAVADTGTMTFSLGAVRADGTIIPQAFTGNTRDGINLEQLNGGTINSTINAVTSTGNGRNGMTVDLDASTLTLTNILNANFDQNTGAGLAIDASNGSTFNVSSITDSTFNNNTEAGLSITGSGTASTVNLGAISNTQFNRAAVLNADGTAVDVPESGGYGIRIETENVTTNANITASEFIAQQALPAGVVSPPSGNLQPGIGGTVDGGGLNLSIGSLTLASDTVTFDGSGDAHIGLVLSGDSVNTVNVLGSTLINADDAQAPDLPASFDGDGIAFDLRDTATLGGSIDTNNIADNEGDGIDFRTGGVSLADFAVIQDFVIQNNKITGHGVGTGQIGEFGNNGIQLVRTATGEINNLQILNNEVDRNANNGLAIDVSGTAKTDTIIANNNSFSDNGWVAVAEDGTPPVGSRVEATGQGSGIAINMQVDANVQLDLTANQINRNADAGIQTTEQIVLATDRRNVTGTWRENTIDENQEDGISIEGATEDLFIGVAGDPTSRNLITNNASDGIEVRAAGSLSIAENLLTGNGTGRVGGTGEGNNLDFDEAANFSQIAAIDLDLLSTSNVSVLNNEIRDNRGDGIEWNNATTGMFTLTASGNEIVGNDGRGFDLLLTNIGLGGTNLTATLNDNNITDNLLQAVYVVTSADVNQQQNVPTSQALLAGGNIESSYSLNLTMNNNQLTANGLDIDNASGAGSSGGAVFRIGTNDGRDSFLSDGGFASEVEQLVLPNNTTVNGAQRGGVNLTMLDNVFTGNNGDDLFIQSFVSTLDPNTTGGEWDNDTFNPVNFNGDPLARLDLTFRGNSIELGQASVTTVGAFYNNAEGEFKSRVDADDNNDQDGPFDSGSRFRNAQRQAGRIFPRGNIIPGLPPTTLAPLDPPIGTLAAQDNFQFRYPGVGDSTFRLNIAGLAPADFATLSGLGFIFDDNPFIGDFSPIETPGEANGLIIGGPGAGPLDDPRFGWGTFSAP